MSRLDRQFERHQKRLRRLHPRISDADVGKTWLRQEQADALGGSITFDDTGAIVSDPQDMLRRYEDKLAISGSLMVLASFPGGATLMTVLTPSEITAALEMWENAVKGKSDPRSETRQGIIKAFNLNAQCDPREGSVLTAALVWLAYTSPVGATIATQPNPAIHYEITDKGSRNYNLRLIVNQAK